MSAEKLKSFILQLGWDGKEAIDGLKAAEGLLKKIKKLGVTNTKPIKYDFGEFDSHVKMFERVQKAEEKAAKKRAKEIDANHSSHVQLYREIELAEKNKAKREKDLAKDKSQNHSQHVLEYNQLKNLEDEKIKREKELAKDKSQNHSEHVNQYKQYITDVRDAEKEAYKEKNQRERDAAKLKEEVRKAEIAAYKEKDKRDAADKKALEEKARAELKLHDSHVQQFNIQRQAEQEAIARQIELNALAAKRRQIMLEISRIEAMGGQLRASDAVLRGDVKLEDRYTKPDYTSILGMDLGKIISSGSLLDIDTALSELKDYKVGLQHIAQSTLALDQRSNSEQTITQKNLVKKQAILDSIYRLQKLGYDVSKLSMQEEDLSAMNMGLKETTSKLAEYHSTLKAISRQQLKNNDAAKQFYDDEARNLDKIALKKKAQNLLDDINRKYKGVDGVIRGPNDAMTQAIEIQIKTIKAFQSRLDKVGTSKGLINMRKVFSQINGDIINMNRNIKSFNQDLSFTQRLAKSINKSMHNFAASWVSAFAIAAGATSVIGLGQDLEAARVGMNIVSGSAEELGKNFEYVKNKSLDFGTNLTETTRSFTKIKAAAELANLSMDDTRNMFESVMEGSVAFGLTQEQTNGVFKAYSDMLSKGTVSLEELKGQLGDRMPTAMGIAAKAMGMTTDELVRLVSSGQLATKDFLPAFSTALRQMANENGALQKALHTSRKEMDRFVTIFQVNVLDAFDAGAESGLATFFQQMGGMLTEMAPVFRIIGNIFGKIAASIGTIAHILYQVFRPFSILLDKVMNQTNAFNSIIGWMQRAVMEIVGVFIAFFGLIEFGLDKLEKMNGTLATIASGVLALFVGRLLGVFSIVQKIFTFFSGIGGVIAAAFSGVAGVIGSVSSALGVAAIAMGKLRGAVFAIGRALKFAFSMGNPWMLGLTLLATVGEWAYDKFFSGDQTTEAEKNAKKAAQASGSITTTTTNHFENHVSVEVADEAKFLEKVLELNEQQNMMAGD